MREEPRARCRIFLLLEALYPKLLCVCCATIAVQHEGEAALVHVLVVRPPSICVRLLLPGQHVVAVAIVRPQNTPFLRKLRPVLPHRLLRLHQLRQQLHVVHNHARADGLHALQPAPLRRSLHEGVHRRRVGLHGQHAVHDAGRGEPVVDVVQEEGEEVCQLGRAAHHEVAAVVVRVADLREVLVGVLRSPRHVLLAPRQVAFRTRPLHVHLELVRHTTEVHGPRPSPEAVRVGLNTHRSLRTLHHCADVGVVAQPRPHVEELCASVRHAHSHPRTAEPSTLRQSRPRGRCHARGTPHHCSNALPLTPMKYRYCSF
eukprot:Rhum_TRINITY_DN23631_c0_g1::Rhum_TRINITY_DN23631_c0_g1_i1::g.178470::m.178470